MKLSKWTTMLPVLVALLLVGNTAHAQEGAADPGGLIAIGSGLAIGLAALGGTLGQGNAARAAYESIARNPQAAGKITTPFFVGMALIESLVIFSFVIAFTIAGSI